MKNAFLIAILGIVALAGGVGLVITAEHYDWLSTSPREPAAAATLCRHQIESEQCPFCHPELVDSMGWCGGHDVPEALCTRCNPALIAAFEAEGDWCVEHSLPESQCALCGAGETTGQASGDRPASLASMTSRDTGAEVMRVNRVPSETCTNAFLTVQLESAAVARRAGLEVEPVRTATIHETVSGNAEVAFDGDRYAHLASRAPGVIAEVNADLGARVEAGDVLAVIDSSELGTAKASYLQARSLMDLWERNHSREQGLFEKNVSTERDVLEAETRLVESRVQLSSARQRLKNLGLSEDDVGHIVESDDTSSHLPLRAPFAGVVVDRHAVPGEVTATSQTLFVIADTRTMWVMLDVYESDLPRLAPGQSVTIAMDALSGRSFEGELTWISAQVDPRTRTIRARAEVDNADGLLRANMFGRAEIQVRRIEDAMLVPESSVQWDGCCNVVFVRHTDTIYQPYKVTLGYKRGGYFVVEDGLPPGESVVTQGSFLLKTEILKGNIGAGCCEVDPGANR